MFKHLLVPVDGSELSERAARVSLELARSLGAKVTGFVAEPMPPLPTMSANVVSYTRETDAHQARTEEHARQVLAEFAAKAAEAGVPFQGKFQRNDDIDDAICHAAAAHGCDLIVMVTHGRGAFGELLYGSHTKNVMTRTQVPLLVLH
jgi:nucleotide-binding universal stress UspA family protein